MVRWERCCWISAPQQVPHSSSPTPSIPPLVISITTARCPQRALTVAQAQNSIAPINPRKLQIVLGTLIGLAALISVALAVNSDAHRRYDSPQTDARINSYATLDRQLAIDGHGVFLRFRGFDARDIGYAAKLYYRAAYDLYPRKVLLADPSVVISNADDITNSESPPDPAWLKAQGIDQILTVHYDPYFQFSVESSNVN